jgi:DNA-binding transcriptional MocR family regulator
MPYTPAQAREAGEHRGYLAADYAQNVAGQPVREPERDDSPEMDDEAWVAFKDGWGAGAEQFAEADWESDHPEADPAEAEAG